MTPRASGRPSFSTAVRGGSGADPGPPRPLHLWSGWAHLLFPAGSGSRQGVRAVACGVLSPLSLVPEPRDTYGPCRQLRPLSLARNIVWGIALAAPS